jgi:hypothetical protein
MMAAAFIATHLHLPLYSIVDGDLREVGGGSRMTGYVDHGGRTLIVDDTIAGGRTWARIKEGGIDTNDAVFLCMYCPPNLAYVPDIVGEILALPHFLEWNLFSCGYMSVAGLDLDGVICEDNYGDPDPKPLYLPRSIACRAIITARPESCRSETVNWLAKWGVQYSELIMWQRGEAERTPDAVADYKCAAVQATGCDFYIESGPGLSAMMRERGVRVLCPAEGFLR